MAYLLAILGVMLSITACSKSEPVASSVKSKLASGEAQPVLDANKDKAGTGNATGATADTTKKTAVDLVAQGTAVWNAKCMSCHKPLAETDKIQSVTSAKDVIDAKAAQAIHGSVASWPTGTDAEAIYTVLNK